jgi:hypothetical protein
MNLFEKEYKDSYLKYHTNPIPDNYLDPRVFSVSPAGGNPIMLPEIKLQIINDIDFINSAEQVFNKTRVQDYIVYGPILKPKSSVKCPINVLVKISTANLDDVLKEKILNNIKTINGRLATGSLHPIVYIPTIRDINLEDYSAAYHPYTDEWLKMPKVLGEADLSLKALETVTSRKHNKYTVKKGIKKLNTL